MEKVNGVLCYGDSRISEFKQLLDMPYIFTNEGELSTYLSCKNVIQALINCHSDVYHFLSNNIEENRCLCFGLFQDSGYCFVSFRQNDTINALGDFSYESAFGNLKGFDKSVQMYSVECFENDDEFDMETLDDDTLEAEFLADLAKDQDDGDNDMVLKFFTSTKNHLFVISRGFILDNFNIYPPSYIKETDLTRVNTENLEPEDPNYNVYKNMYIITNDMLSDRLK